MESILVTKNINRIFPIAGKESFQALKDINIEVPSGKLAILRGRSGSGKTTLINILGALDTPTSGQVYFNGKEITEISEKEKEKIRRMDIGFIFQSVSLIPNMTAFENVEFALRLSEYKGDRKARAEECLKQVGLGGRMYHMPQEMSGGEQQRVAIARAISHKPSIIIADEPTAELDTTTSFAVVNLFKELVEKEKITIIMTTHDVGLMSAGDIVLQLEDGEIVNE